jgi:hypothetical protein
MKRSIAVGITFAIFTNMLISTEDALAAEACTAANHLLCYGNAITAAAIVQAIPIIAAAKGRFRDLGECEEVARDAGRLAGVIGGGLAQALAGHCGECACDAAY